MFKIDWWRWRRRQLASRIGVESTLGGKTETDPETEREREKVWDEDGVLNPTGFLDGANDGGMAGGGVGKAVVISNTERIINYRRRWKVKQKPFFALLVLT